MLGMSVIYFTQLLLLCSVVSAKNAWNRTNFRDFYSQMKGRLNGAQLIYKDFRLSLLDNNTSPAPSTPPSVPPLLSVRVECMYTNGNGTELACESTNFTELALDKCEVDVSYTYTIINRSEKEATLDYLLDESLKEIVVDSLGGSNLLENDVFRTFQTSGVINICLGDDKITKKVLAIASPVDTSSEKLPYAEDSITIQPPELPIDIEFDDIECSVNDENSTDCMTYYRTTTSSSECVVDLSLNYTFTNIGLACLNIAAVKAEIGPLGNSLLDFNDVYSYQERELCTGETWTIPDRRVNVDICGVTDMAWDVFLEIDDFDGRSANATFAYEWQFFPSAIPSLSSKPSAFLSSQPSSFPSIKPTAKPSAAPTIDSCDDCTLTGLINGVSRIKLWGNGKENLAFQGVCDVIAIDNDYLQVQIRTRPGNNNAAWTGVIQVGLLWKETQKILFLFVPNKNPGDTRFLVNNVDSHQDVVEYSRIDNPNIEGMSVHTFQFIAVADDNFIRVEELPYGLYNVEVKGFGTTFGKARGLVGAWERWAKDERIILRDPPLLYSGTNALLVAKSWKVKPQESFLFQPSDVCVAETKCGPGDPDNIECIVETYSAQRLGRQAESGCSCEDINDKMLRSFCEESTKTTGFNFWACSYSSLNSIINQSQPPACPAGCFDDATDEKFFIRAANQTQNCLWAIRVPSLRKTRCAIPEVSLNCCASCCTACTADAAGTGQFLIPEEGENFQGTCAWAASEDPTTRCSYESVLRNCCFTCETAVPSDKPSDRPSIFSSVRPSSSPIAESHAPTAIPSKFSHMPSQHPTSEPTILKTDAPSDKPTDAFSLTPSIHPSKSPTNVPTANPTRSPSKKPTKTPTRTPTMTPTAIHSQSPSIEPSSFPSHIPSAIPSLSPSVTISQLPSSIPSIFPSSKPSLLQSSIPSSYPSAPPSISPAYVNEHPTSGPSISPGPTEIESPSPTVIPSSGPSMSPSDSPSYEPSSIPTLDPTRSSYPTLSGTCDSSLFVGDYALFTFLNFCWRAEFFEGGGVTADFSSAECSKLLAFPVHFSDYEIPTGNFIPGPLGWSGSFVFKENSNIQLTGEATAVVAPTSVWNTTSLTFEIHLLVPSCNY